MSDWAEARRTNQRMWDERVPIHVGSDFYDVKGFKAGQPRVEPFEIDELGALGGVRMAHLQCHFGMDTLDLVRLHPTMTATGLDFSQPAVDAATELARELHLDDRASFVHADVYDASNVLATNAFDLVYTGKGAICWLPDLPSWSAQCAKLLKPGGWLYLCEYHPTTWAFDEKEPVVRYDYFTTEPWVDETEGTYADRNSETKHNRSFSWGHSVANVISSVIGAGLELRFFHEWPFCHSDMAEWLVRGDDGRFRWPGPGQLPLMYSLKAQKPTS